MVGGSVVGDGLGGKVGCFVGVAVAGARVGLDDIGAMVGLDVIGAGDAGAGDAGAIPG